MGFASSEDLEQPGHPPDSSLVTRKIAKPLKDRAYNEDWLDWADATADESSLVISFVTQRLF